MILDGNLCTLAVAMDWMRENRDCLAVFATNPYNPQVILILKKDHSEVWIQGLTVKTEGELWALARRLRIHTKHGRVW